MQDFHPAPSWYDGFSSQRVKSTSSSPLWAASYNEQSKQGPDCDI